MREANDEMERRRNLQLQFNQEHGITPQSIRKRIDDGFEAPEDADYYTVPVSDDPEMNEIRSVSQLHEMINAAEKEMLNAAEKLDFEQAAGLRDKIKKLKEREIALLQ
jgi:excinuclease ABC subunit B